MSADDLFAYVFAPDDPRDMERRCAALAEAVRAHAAKHDFAQKMFSERFRVETVEIDGATTACVVAPFVRENIRELGALNYYAKAVGETLGFRLVAMMLPDSTLISLRANPD